MAAFWISISVFSWVYKSGCRAPWMPSFPTRKNHGEQRKKSLVGWGFLFGGILPCTQRFFLGKYITNHEFLRIPSLINQPGLTHGIVRCPVCFFFFVCKNGVVGSISTILGNVPREGFKMPRVQTWNVFAPPKPHFSKHGLAKTGWKNIRE